MSNPFYYLAGLLFLAAYPMGSEPLAFVGGNAAPWAFLGALVLYAAVCWTVLRPRPYNAPLIRLILRALALILYAELIFIFHLPLWIWQLGVEQDPLASTLLGLAPLFALYGILALIHNRVEPHSGGLRFAFRSFAGLSLLPLSLMLLLDEAFEKWDALGRLAFVYPAVAWILILGGLTLLMVFLPPLLALILGARPMPAGPLRDRLERMADTAGYRGSRLYIVPTGTSKMANAFVAGLSSVFRYIFFTEAILQGMSPDDLDCVLAHEVTHARKRHILFYLVSALAFSLFSGLAHEALSDARVPEVALFFLMLTWAGLYWVVGFGYVSRRFETEADLVAARLAPPPEGGLPPYAAARKMAAALHRVADLNNVPIWAPSWRHFTIQRRIDILLRAEVDPAVGAVFEKVCDRLRAAAFLMVAVGVISGGVLLVLQHNHAAETRALLAAHDSATEGRRLLEAGQYPEALDYLKRGIAGGSTRPEVWIWRADAERALGLVGDALKSEAEARKKGITDPRLRLHLPE